MRFIRFPDPSNNVMFENTDDSGVLIAFEGSDGAGKTTQRKLFKRWLEGHNGDIVVTKWNSSPLFHPIIKARKTARSLDSVSYAILHAADFRHRYETIILPSLRAGKIVLADRYIFTGIARDVARGIDRSWSAELYSRVRRPDIVFYFAASAETCVNRIRSSRELKFYEAGQDVTHMADAVQSFLQFVPRVLTEYQSLAKANGFITVDAELPIYEQHRLIRETFQQRVRDFRPALVPVPAGAAS